MKTRFIVLMGLLFLIMGCELESIENPPLVGEWRSIDYPPIEVLITDSMIYVEDINLSCRYTISNNQLHITRLWLPSSHRDYVDYCDYYFKVDTLVICDFIPSIANMADDGYCDVELIK